MARIVLYEFFCINVCMVMPAAEAKTAKKAQPVAPEMPNPAASASTANQLGSIILNQRPADSNFEVESLPLLSRLYIAMARFFCASVGLTRTDSYPTNSPFSYMGVT